MEKSDIQKLRELPIEGVAERLGLEVRKHTCLCPFHDDHTPSLRFSVSRNTFKCFVCDAHGGVIDLAMKVLGQSFVETCQWLANENNIILMKYKASDRNVQQPKYAFDPQKYAKFFDRPYLNEVAIDFLYHRRHLDARVIRWCRLNSYCDRNGTSWLQIPYYDTQGHLTGIQLRNLTPSLKGREGEPIPRFRFPYGSQCHIYNLPVIPMLRPQEPLYIAEGCSDCWSLLSAGHKAIAIPSATLLKSADLKLLEPLRRLETPLHMYPDADIPGERLYLELTNVATQLGCCLYRHSLPAGCKDYSEYYLIRS